MASDSIVRILVDEDGNFIAVPDGGSPARGFVGLGVDDGGVARAVKTDPAGRQEVAGVVGITGPIERISEPVSLTGSLQRVVEPVGITGPIEGIVGPVGVTGPVERISEPVGLTGPLQRIVEPVGITGPVGVTGIVRVLQPTASSLNAIVQGPGVAGLPTGGVITVQGVSGAQPHPAVGAVGVGATPSVNPVLVAGQDGSVVRTVLTDSGGRPISVLHDGTYGPVAVKDSITAPSSSDKALVVVISPNQQAIPVSASPATSTAGLVFGTIALAGGTAGGIYPIRSTTYNEQTTNAQRSIASSSANDASAGTGARAVEITYYDQTGAGPFTETVTLNGTTPVNTVATNICFIEKMVVTTVGSVGTNVGTVTLYVSTGGAGGTIGTIGIGTVVSGTGDGRTLWAHHYVPSGKTANITGIAVGATQPATFHLKARPIGVANAAEVIITGLTTTTNAFQRTFGSPDVVVGPARIVAYGVPSTNGVTLSASLDFFEATT